MKPLSAVAAGLVLLIAADASAWCRMTTSRRRPTAMEPCILPDPNADPPEHFLEWLRPCHSMAISVAAPSRDLTEAELEAVLGRSLATWNEVTCDGQPLGIQLEVLDERSTCTGALYRDGSGNANTFIFVLDWASRMYDANAFAITTVWHRRSTGEILDVDMEINERRGPYGICPPDGCDATRMVDLENVITHEMGHFLGLAHSQDAEATMFASSIAGETIKRDLNADDIEGICTIYPEGRPAGECTFEPTGGLILDCEPRGCGCRATGDRQAPAWAWAVAGLVAPVWRRRR